MLSGSSSLESEDGPGRDFAGDYSAFSGGAPS